MVILNYHLLSKEQRSNSYLEKYNRRLKQKLSDFLYGKNRCHITWPLFLYFIKKEENDYRLNIYNKETEPEIKKSKINKFIETEEYIENVLNESFNKLKIDNKIS